MSSTEFTPTGQIQFNAFFQGVNTGTIWKSPESGSQIEFESFRRIAQTAERGKFAAFFLAEGLRMREQNGKVFELDVAGRPDNQSMLASLAAVTENLGLVATQNSTFNDPVELARRLQSLDLLSEGRAAWNLVTTDNAWTGANFRRGGYLDHADRYEHAERFLDVAKDIWAGRGVEHVGKHYSIDHQPQLPVSPQGRPVLFQAGMSPSGRDFAAKNCDVIFTVLPNLPAAQEFRADIVERTRKFGRPANDVKITPVVEFILAPTAQEAEEKRQEVRRLQVGPQQAIAFLEQFWGTDLSAYDPDGPLPEIDPVVEETDGSRGVAFQASGVRKKVEKWREEAEAKNWSIRDLATSELVGRQNPVAGSYDAVAEQMTEYADTGAVDGFCVAPWLIPTGLDDVVNELVPRLQDRGCTPRITSAPPCGRTWGCRRCADGRPLSSFAGQRRRRSRIWPARRGGRRRPGDLRSVWPGLRRAPSTSRTRPVPFGPVRGS